MGGGRAGGPGGSGPLRGVPCERPRGAGKCTDRSERGHDDEPPGATLGACVARRELDEVVRRLRRGGRRLAQQRADAAEGGAAAAIAEHPVVADVLKAFGEVVEEEAPEELDASSVMVRAQWPWA